MPFILITKQQTSGSSAMLLCDIVYIVLPLPKRSREYLILLCSLIPCWLTGIIVIEKNSSVTLNIATKINVNQIIYSLLLVTSFLLARKSNAKRVFEVNN